MFNEIAKISKIKSHTKRVSSWDVSGRNSDSWRLPPKSTTVIADIKGPAKITHIWLTQGSHYREVLIRITWDDAKSPSICCPIGDFFCLGHGIVNSFESLFFTASTAANNMFNAGCALNCYAPMPFRKRALIELINESNDVHNQYFHVDYEAYADESSIAGMGYFHAEFKRENPFGGWAHEIMVNVPEADIVNKEKLAWDNNYVLLETKGKGHYIGCNYSVTNFQGTWWGEGDDMVWIDGYHWPPDLHGTGSEDYFNQAWGMQGNAQLRNGSSIFEKDTKGYQTSYIFHVENPMRFEKEIKVTIEFGHGNHLRNEVSSVAYWYAEVPTQIQLPPPVEKRMPVQRTKDGWVFDPKNQITSREVPLNAEMHMMKRRTKARKFPEYVKDIGQLVVNDEQHLCVKLQLSRDNPELYEIPFEELLEAFVNRMADVFVIKDPEKLEKNPIASGKIILDATGKIAIKAAKATQSFNELVKDLISQKILLEALKILDEDKKEGKKEEFELFIMKQ